MAMAKDDDADSPHLVVNNPKLTSSPLQNPNNLPLVHPHPHPHPPLQNPNNLPLIHPHPHPHPPLQNPNNLPLPPLQNPNNLPLAHLQPPPHPDPPLPPLCPFTPNPIHEHLDSPSSTTSPSSPASPHSPAASISIPLTPRDAVFDPFAPAPHHLLLAPLPQKLLTHSIQSVARRLNFNDDDDDDDDDVDVPHGRHCTKDDSTLSDDLFLDTVYQTLLQVIVKKQTEDFVAQTLQQPRTPTSTPPFTGIAHTCPGAPLKPVSRKPRNVTPGWCRKLEF